MEQGFVFLNLKYSFETKKPQISLIKQLSKLLADSICANISPDKLDTPSFWLSKDNFVQLVELDVKKPRKIVPSENLKFNFEER
jgi:hypothetical protein